MTNKELKKKAREIRSSLMLEVREYNIHDKNCYDLCVEFYKRCFDIELPNYNYDHKTNIPPSEVHNDWEIFHDKLELEIGDIIAFQSIAHKDGIHLGVYLGDGDFLDSQDAPCPIRVSSLDDVITEIKYYARYTKIRRN